MHCPRCTSAMQSDVRDVTQTYKEESITIEQVHGHFCSQCGLMVPDEGEAGRMVESGSFAQEGVINFTCRLTL